MLEKGTFSNQKTLEKNKLLVKIAGFSPQIMCGHPVLFAFGSRRSMTMLAQHAQSERLTQGVKTTQSVKNDSKCEK